MKTDVIDGSILSGVRHPLFCSFVLEKPPGYKVFCEAKTIQNKKLKESVLNTITFYLEDDVDKEVNFKVETLPFTLQMNDF